MTSLEKVAYDIGAKGSEPTEEERLAFESWMRGHCWAVIGEWDGKQYKHAHESTGFVHGGAMETRRLWAAWRDRGAVARVLAEQAQAVEPVTDGNWLWCKLMDFCKKRGYAPAAFDDLFAIVGEARAQQVAVPEWTAEQIDEFEIRVKSPEGEAWRLRSADKNDIFNNFIWRWAQSMIAAQGVKK